jgi:hypothetical protein
MFSSFLLGSRHNFAAGNLSAAERGLSEKGTKFVFCRFSCHIRRLPLPRGQNLSSALLLIAHRHEGLYAAPQAADNMRALSRMMRRMSCTSTTSSLFPPPTNP